jgi:hypothetical protein
MTDSIRIEAPAHPIEQTVVALRAEVVRLTTFAQSLNQDIQRERAQARLVQAGQDARIDAFQKEKEVLLREVTYHWDRFADMRDQFSEYRRAGVWERLVRVVWP